MFHQVGEDYLCDVIHAFNERGFGALPVRQGAMASWLISPSCRANHRHSSVRIA
ncbi:hypothetical protein [Streptomyces sp. NPDC051286]|uniref:hypothetical protein n=1 Tax=Streptomyces sp. NPDC051286 TaxID=3365647 RepID=UPI003797F9B2